MTEPDDPAWLILRERGEDVSHVPETTRASYDALAALFDELELEAPGPDWKQRALAALDREAQHDSAARVARDAPAEWSDALSRGARRARIWAAAGSIAAAAVLAIVIGLCGEDLDDRRARARAAQAVVASGEPAVVGTPQPAGTAPSPDPAAPGRADAASAAGARAQPEVRTEVRRGAQRHRGDGVSIGDTWIIQVSAGGPVELRVYGDTGEPLARCGEDPRCTIERGAGGVRLRLELELRAPGDARAVLFRSALTAGSAAGAVPATVPAAFESLDADIEAARRAQVDAQQIGVVRVQ